VASFVAFLKALPVMVGLMKDLVDGIKDMQDALTEKKFRELDAKIEETIKDVKKETDRNKLLALARELNGL
jgi:hypothetical protein